MQHFANTGNAQLDAKCDFFRSNPTPDSALDILICCRCSNHIDHCIEFGEYFLTLFPYNNFNILNEIANSLFYKKQYEKAALMYTSILKYQLSHEFSNMVLYNLTFTLNCLKNTYSAYNQDNIHGVSKNPIPYVTLSITTCKRLDLFERTMNSFLNCVLDKHLISEYICIDDNSSEEDREIMKKKYPFFNFYFKTEGERGHPRSMNLIKQMCKTPYLFHIEDDWEFLIKDNYISKCIHVLGSNPGLKQCLLNKNYGEVPCCLGSTVGGEYHVTPKTREGEGGIRYYVHEHMSGADYAAKYGSQKNCAYWPHFSFRPSVIITSIFQEIGDFNENCVHFEMEYANRYVAKGYKSAFLEGIYCVHIGRLTSDRSGVINAYDLNNQQQFQESNKYEKIPFKCYVVNLDRREDRWTVFKKRAEQASIEECWTRKYRRFPAIDGKKLRSTRQLRRIFDPNNYNWTRGVIGCALSHIRLWCDLVNGSENGLVVLEDDVQFCPLFKTKLAVVYNDSKQIPDWDIIELGTSRRSVVEDQPYKMPKLHKKNTAESFSYSYGGNIGYMISRNGALKMLEYLNVHGAICAIDTMIFYAADAINLYFVDPAIVKSDCLCSNPNTDTDIQRGYNDKSTYMDIPFNIRINDEISVFGTVNMINEISHLDPNVVNICYYPGKHADGYKWYEFGNGSLYVSDKMYEKLKDDLWFDRLKFQARFSVENAIEYLDV